MAASESKRGHAATTRGAATPSKWHAAALASRKSGGRRTMCVPRGVSIAQRHSHRRSRVRRAGRTPCRYFVDRHKVENAAVRSDSYIPRGSYAGEWAGDKREGFGAQIFANGDKCVVSAAWECDEMALPVAASLASR